MARPGYHKDLPTQSKSKVSSPFVPSVSMEAAGLLAMSTVKGRALL